ncbi:hypothetical protein FCG12_00180 [Neisseria meningitidis]|nr:hypothetical protein [Neisseria meningitidis]
MYKIKCFYDQFGSGELFNYCQFLDNSSNQKINTRGTVYQYIIYVLTGDLYLQKDIDENLEFIHQAENNPNEVYSGGGQGFCWDISAEKVVFYNNEFDEEDGWPDLSCSLHTFKTTLIAWNAFLQLPKSIHSVVETVIEE